MKNFVFIFTIALFTTACSSCYECYQQIPLLDANTGDTIGYTTDTDDFCTADASEVSEREAEGAVCEPQ
ncbi:MAG: hypothetical protein RLP15_03860 [Cryomorphaceae bacterium]